MVNNLAYWLNEVEEGLKIEQLAFVRIGRALKSLRGTTHKIVNHMWRQDTATPSDVTTFAEYCRFKWNFSKATVTRYIQAYEVVEDIDPDGKLPMGNFSMSERLVRPLVKLKKEEQRQQAWELANRLATEEDEKLTANHTALAADLIEAGEVVGSKTVTDAIESLEAEEELEEYSNKNSDVFQIVVKFTVLAKGLAPWSSEECAIDYLRHTIDEGYQMEEVEDWEIVSVSKMEDGSVKS